MRCGLSKRPTAHGPKLENRRPLDRRVMWAALSRDLFHPGVLDAQSLPEQEDLLSKPGELRLQPGSGVDAVRGDAAGVGQRTLCQRNRLDDADRIRRGQQRGIG